MVLWDALADATDAVQAAVDADTRESTCQSRAAMIAAYHVYADALYPVVGQAMAFTYESSLADVFSATGAEDEASALQAHAGVMVDLEAAVRRATARWNAENGVPVEDVPSEAPA